MAEWISNAVVPWVLPPGGILTLLLVGIALRASGLRRLAWGVLALTGLLLWFVSTPICARWMADPLESRHSPVAAEAAPQADAILVLGGGARPSRHPSLGPDLGASADRIWMAGALFTAGRAPLIVVSGGRQHDQWPSSEAEAMRFYLERWGIPSDAIALESRSHSTVENCQRSAEILRERGVERVLFVTSALHMPRALAVCRAAGIDALPVPTDFSPALPTPMDGDVWLPDARALAASSRALKEYLAIAAGSFLEE